MYISRQCKHKAKISTSTGYSKKGTYKIYKKTNKGHDEDRTTTLKGRNWYQKKTGGNMDIHNQEDSEQGIEMCQCKE